MKNKYCLEQGNDGELTTPAYHTDAVPRTSSESTYWELAAQ